MISIVTVAFNSDDFAELLLESVGRTRSEPVRVVVVDNGHRRFARDLGSASYVRNESDDRSHGRGLNLALAEVRGGEVLILDVDCHLLAPGWEGAFRDALGDAHCLSVPGPPEKPIRPACCFLRASDAVRYDWRATPGYRGHRVTPWGSDVGIAAYREMRRDGREVRFLESREGNRYGTATGEEYGAGGTMYVYHHWHGTHLPERQYDYAADLAAEKDLLFRGVPWRRRTTFL